jgi:Raf kinase inhibitor-like YbhB/YbcL family protein
MGQDFWDAVLGGTIMHTLLKTVLFLMSICAVMAQGGLTMAMEIKSPSFDQGRTIPRRHTCDGPDLSPALKWSGVPDNAKALALISDDPDAPVGTWVHWVLYDLPGETRSLPEGVPTTETLPRGGAQGRNDFGRIGYGGPCPPPGRPHRYFFKLYALDARVNMPPGATKEALLKAMRGHVLAEAELMGTYGR